MSDGSLETRHLTLVPGAAEHFLALIESAERFALVTGLRVAPELRGYLVSDDVSPAWVAALQEAHGPDPWRHGFFVRHRDSGTVIGSAGFKGPPDAAGMVEIAYGVVPAYEGRGYATEAAAALVRFASRNGAVRLIRAHTRPEPNASTRILEKCGFHRTGEIVDPDDGPVWRWERSPEGHAAVAIHPLMHVPVPWVFVLAYLAGFAVQRLVPVPVPAPGALRFVPLAGAVLFAAGVALAAWSLWIFRRVGTTTVPFETSSRLVTWGPYRVSRNPMYVSLTLAYLGEAGILAQVWPLVFLVPTLAYVDRIVIPVEEARLREAFGAAYRDYCARVRRWV